MGTLTVKKNHLDQNFPTFFPRFPKNFPKLVQIFTLSQFSSIETTHWHPKCYLARQDLLVLEDLNLSGYKHLVHRTRFDRSLVECVLRSVAAIHADSIAYETKVHPKNIGDLFGCYRHEFAVDKKWFQMGLEVSNFVVHLFENF